MNNSSSVTSVSSNLSAKSASKITLRKTRGAAMVEYALLLVAIMLLSAGAFKTLGRKVNKSVKGSSQVL